MPLPTPAERKPLHVRTITLEGFVRSDGLWDIEGRLLDQKTYDFYNSRGNLHRAGQAVHDMSVRLTLDDERFVVDAVASMDAVPYGTCLEVPEVVRALIGAQVGAGWKRTVQSRLPLRASCTHLAELIVTMATAAFQTQGFGKEPEGKNPWPAMRETTETPYMMGQCHSWQLDSEVTKAVFPLIYHPKPPQP